MKLCKKTFLLKNLSCICLPNRYIYSTEYDLLKFNLKIKIHLKIKEPNTCSFNKYLLNIYYVPSIMLSAGNIMINKNKQ